MKIGIRDLHPRVGEIVMARVMAMRMAARPQDATANAILAKRWRGWGWRVLAALPIGAGIGAAMALLFGASTGDVAGAAFMSAYFCGIGTGVGSLILGRFGRKNSISAEELRALSRGLEVGDSESIYLDSVCALLEAGDNVAEQTGRDILTTLGDLLEQAIYVGDRLDRLQKAASTESTSELEQERARLAERMERIQDPQAHADLAQSLGICDERLLNARALEPLIERLEAQYEVIRQTFLSVQSSINRLQVAPAALAAPDVEDVRRVITDVTAQTRAVEDAVQQVVALRH